MLSYELIHPEILAALGRSGHGSQVLISDGHFPHSTGANPAATRVWLNLAPGRLDSTEILRVLTGAITIDAAQVMSPDTSPEPEVHGDFRAALPGIKLAPLHRFDFYAACQRDSVALVIASGDIRPFANILLTQGVRAFSI
jgi:L-fucose mutarotase